MKHHTVALLPMKANSERVTGKNFRDFCGKPLFRWMLDTLIAVTRIEKVVINTDARSILADHGLVEGGKIIIRDRPAEICGDHVSMNAFPIIIGVTQVFLSIGFTKVNRLRINPVRVDSVECLKGDVSRSPRAERQRGRRR